MWSVALCVVAVVVVGISHWFYKWANLRRNHKLPPGSMGFPIIGDNIEFFKPFGLNEVPPFVKNRTLRYGPLFRMSILGSNTIVSTDPEVSFEILRQENKSFTAGYPDGFVRLFGKDNIFLKQGHFHKYIRLLSQQFLGPESLKQNIIHQMNQTTREHLNLKAQEGVLEVKDTVSSLIMEFVIPAIISDIDHETKSKIIDSLKAFGFDFFESPFKLSSWKALHNALKVRGNAIKIMKDLITRRKASKQTYGDFLDDIVGEVEKQGTILNETSAKDFIFHVLFLAQESVGTATGIIVKYLSENPKVLAELKREHEGLVQNRANKDSGVTWEEYKSMIPFTHMVINESLRLSTSGLTFFRKAVNDYEVKGYTIPSGWIVLVATAGPHHDPKTYENPSEFNPWRWEGKELHGGSKTFMAFGGGARLCVGALFARLQMAIFIHHLVRNYEFSLAEPARITLVPLVVFSKGIRIKISESRK